MGVIATNRNLITIYTLSHHQLLKKCLAIAKTHNTEIQLIEIDKTKITGTEWAELANMLGTSISDFVQKDDVKRNLNSSNDITFDDEDAVKLLQNYPESLKHPIALRNDKAVLIKSENDILKL